MNVIYRVNITNQFESETVQKILFKLGHFWGSGGRYNVKYINIDLYDNIGVWTNRELSMGHTSDNRNISFEQFITKIETEYATI
jgi:hypothetical protein